MPEQPPETSPDSSLSRPALTLTEAADATGVSRGTIRRYLDQGRFPNAYRTHGAQGPETGPWKVPIEDLLAAELTVNAPKPAPPRDLSQGLDLSQDRREQSEPSEAQRLRDEIAEWRRRAEVAETRAEERQERIRALERAQEDLRLALRALGPGDLAVQPEAAVSLSKTPERGLEPAAAGERVQGPERVWRAQDERHEAGSASSAMRGPRAPAPTPTPTTEAERTWRPSWWRRWLGLEASNRQEAEHGPPSDS